MSVTGTNISLTLRQVKGSELTHKELDDNQSGLKTAVESHSHDEFAPALGADDNYVTDAEKTKLSNLSGTNTGDQDLTGLLNETSHDLLDHTGLTGVPAAHTLPTASTSVLGGVKVDGTTILISDGVISSTGGSGGGVTDHGALTGLSDDDHTQYLNETRHDQLDHTGLTGIPTQYTDEMAQDAVGAAIAAGTQTGITVAYDDANNKINFTVTASGAGDVTGPASSVDSNFALFNGTTGKVIKDGGVKASDFATASHNHTSVYEPANANIQSHISSTSNQHPATSITNTPAGNILATTVQAAINELDTEKAAVTQLHDAVTVADSTSIDLTLTGQQISAAAIFGTTSGTVAEGNHNHSGIYQPADQQLTDLAGLSYSGNGGKVIAVTAGADGLELISVSTGTGMINPMTASGDIIVGGTSGTPARLAKGSDGQVLTLASGTPAWAAASGGDGPLVAERIITAEDGAQTSITFSDLDGNADGGYVLVYGAKNATASNSSIKITINNDDTANNYNWREIFKSSTGSGTASADGADNAILNGSGGYLAANLDNAVVINIVPSIDSTTIFTTDSYINGAVDFITTKYKSSTNITRIDLTASVASSIAVGSTFRLYKRK